MTYTTAGDVEVRWRPLTDAERVVAEALVADAEDMLIGRWPDLLGRVDAGSLRQATVVRVVAAMVRRAMLNRDGEGVEQRTMTVGPFSNAAQYANPNSNLYVSADEAASLEPAETPRSFVGWLA